MTATARRVVIAGVAVGALTLAMAALPGGFGGGWSWLVQLIAETQRGLHRDLADAVRAVRDAGPAAALWLIGLSFAYGIFHAAGPGHGKVVISTYLLTHESRLKRGIALAFASSLVQGLSALLIVWVAVGLLGWAFRDARGAADDLELASFALVGILGFVLMAAAARRLWVRHTTTGHTHVGDADACGHCGHSHGVSHADLDRAATMSGMAGVVLSVGLRPCSGGVLVLLFAHVAGVAVSGAIAVMAMSLGTAITVSALAILAVHARRASVRLAEAMPGESGGRVGWVLDAAAFCGGAIVLALGVGLVADALNRSAHPLF